MRRRHFLLGALNAGGSERSRAASNRKAVIALVDGFGPEYFEKSDMPALRRIKAGGGFKVVSGMVPSVTNVNNASLATATFPDEHGITTNFYYDPAKGTAEEMKSPRFLKRPTILERAAAKGWKTAIVSSKDKIRTLCSGGAAIAVSAEKPESRFLGIAGEAESMYSAAVNYWSLRMARHLLLKEGVDLLYLSTTDYMMHTYAPDEAHSLEHLHVVDKMLGEILDDHPRIESYLTADHGMNSKSRALDPVKLLRAAGIDAASAPLISDSHKIHHQDLGGSYYIYLRNPNEAAKAIRILKAEPEIEEVLTRKDAAARFRLMATRIGDLFTLARKDAVFGDLDAVRKRVRVRTHGSAHEAAVPLFIHGKKADLSGYRYNFDLTRFLDLERS
jgi:phosphonoacetate hydrolase